MHVSRLSSQWIWRLVASKSKLVHAYSHFTYSTLQQSWILLEPSTSNYRSLSQQMKSLFFHFKNWFLNSPRRGGQWGFDIMDESVTDRALPMEFNYCNWRFTVIHVVSCSVNMILYWQITGIIYVAVIMCRSFSTQQMKSLIYSFTKLRIDSWNIPRWVLCLYSACRLWIDILEELDRQHSQY